MKTKTKLASMKHILLSFTLWVTLLDCSESLSSSPNSSFQQTTRNVATQTLQGAGIPLVDMNQYNIPLSQIEDEWTANFVQEAAKNEQQVFLDTKNNRKNFVDTISVTFPRKKDSGLGIELAELAGGREDGLGITVVTGLVPNGSAEGSDIQPGDSISEVSVVQIKRGGDDILDEKREITSVRTECFAYDSTVDAILSLPAASSTAEYEEFFTLKLRRIRRRPKVNVRLQYPPEQNEPDTTIEMFAGENLRQGMLVRGVKLNDELAKRFDTKSGGNCGGSALCRTCSVSVLNGGDLLNPQRVAEKQMLQGTPRWRLACKAIVGYGMKEGDMTIRVNTQQWQQ